MTLSAADLEARTRSLGASEVGAVAGLDPNRSGLDVWAGKRRGPGLELPPLVVDNGPDDEDKPLAVFGRLDTAPMVLGNLFEDAIANAYAHRTGHVVLPTPGRVMHPVDSWASATPDRLLKDGGGLEVKLVGRFRRAHWPSDGVPEYVCCQVQWQMWIADWPFADVAALIDGTDLRIIRVERDDEMIEALVEIGRRFWEDHVLADVMPEATRGDDAARVLQARWRTDNGETLELGGDMAAKAEEIARGLVLAQERKKRAESDEKILKAMLCAMTGPHHSIAGEFGRFDWPSVQGTPLWKSIAEEIAGGAVPHDIIEKHRAAGYRRAQLFPHQRWKARQLAAVAAPPIEAKQLHSPKEQP